ncbi:MAG TPA: hypothetical protein VFN67_08650 [Polyangiales bacterium]|nr:hypothetical protein [Polyangiales bacterium]
MLLIGLIACSMLLHEILLTRVCALRVQFHFAFLIISNCLLGFGAAGTYLSLKHDAFQRDSARWLERTSLAYLLSLLVTYFGVVTFPLPGFILTANPWHMLLLSLFNLLGALPFFFAGLVIGILLSISGEQSNRLYAADLLAAALGCGACPVLLPWVGAGGVFVTSALLALAAWATQSWPGAGMPQRAATVALCLIGLISLPQLDRWLPVPTRDEQYAKPNQTRQSVWTSNSRIDLTTTPGCEAELSMRGKKSTAPRPRECASIGQDATAATTIVNYSEEPAALDVLRQSMYVASYRLKPNPSVLVIGLGGGNDVWAAHAMGARSIRAIELNWPIVDIHQKVLRRFSSTLVDDPSVELVVGEGRSAVMHDQNKYSVVHMTGIDTWTALVSGAYVLAENYLYTREAISALYDHLEPNGILQISRYSFAMEALRLLSTVNAALTSAGVEQIEPSIMVLSAPDSMMAVQIKRGAFTAEEQASTLAFAEQNGFVVEYMPNKPGTGWIETFIRAKDKPKLIDQFPLNIAPVNDDRPYFFNYLKWQSPFKSVEQIEAPTALSQGNPAFILTQLLLSVLLSAGLIVYPLARGQGFPRKQSRPFLWYFSALGIGFISVELAIIQKLTLFLGQPVYSLTVTLFGLLVFAGIGSLLIAERIEPGSRQANWIPIAIFVYLALLNLGLPTLVDACIGAPLPVRIAVTLVLLAPLGMLLGVPFAYGLRVAQQVDPRIVPWAWAVNGCLSVVGSILSVVVSMNLGFSAVLWIASLIYPAGFIALHGRWTRSPQPTAASGTVACLNQPH